MLQAIHAGLVNRLDTFKPAEGFCAVIDGTYPSAQPKVDRRMQSKLRVKDNYLGTAAWPTELDFTVVTVPRCARVNAIFSARQGGWYGDERKLWRLSVSDTSRLIVGKLDQIVSALDVVAQGLADNVRTNTSTT